MISFDTIVDYVFKKLPEEQCRDLEQELENDPELTELVDNVFNYCIQYHLTSKELFLKKWDENLMKRDYMLNKLLKKIDNKKNSNKQ